MMKTLRKLIILSIFIGGFAFTGCKDRDASNNQPVEVSQQEPGQPGEKCLLDTMATKQVMNSIEKLASQVEMISKKQESNSKGLEKIKEDVKEMKDSSHRSSFISWIIAVVALIILIAVLLKIHYVNGRVSRHRREIDKLSSEVSSLMAKIKSDASSGANIGYRGGRNSEYSSLASRLVYIERKLNDLSRDLCAARTNVPQQGISQAVSQQIFEQKGFFGLPVQQSLTDAYFRHLADSRQPDSYFTVTVRGDNAEFRLIEGAQYLNEVKSNDDIKMALAIEGCEPSIARQMRMVKPGEAVKTGDRWKITKKAIIDLS